MKRYDMLINFTGGLDSTYAVYNYLLCNPDKSLLIHHCVLSNYQKRQDKETEAVKNIINWLKTNGLRNFDYIETALDVSSLPPGVNDIEVVGFLNGCLLRARNYHIENIAITASAQDFTQGESYNIRSKSRFEIIKLVAKKDPNYVYPIRTLTRHHMITGMPKELTDLIWFCRMPRNGKECRLCKPCRWTLMYLNR